MKKLRKNKTQLVLSAIEGIAKRNANAACAGFIYEPQVPKKLKK